MPIVISGWASGVRTFVSSIEVQDKTVDAGHPAVIGWRAAAAD